MTGYEVPLAQTSIKGMNASIDPLVIVQGIQLEGIVGLVACVAALLVAVWVLRCGMIAYNNSPTNATIMATTIVLAIAEVITIAAVQIIGYCIIKIAFPEYSAMLKLVGCV